MKDWDTPVVEMDQVKVWDTPVVEKDLEKDWDTPVVARTWRKTGTPQCLSLIHISEPTRLA